MPQDEALIILFYNGIEEGFEELCRRWYASGKLIEFFERGGAMGHGLELAQEVMLALYHSRSDESARFSGGTFSAFIFQIAQSILGTYIGSARPIAAVSSERYWAAHPADIRVSGPCRLEYDNEAFTVELPPNASLLDLVLELEQLSPVRTYGLRFRITNEPAGGELTWRLHANKHRNKPPSLADAKGRNLLPNRKDAVLDLRAPSNRPRCHPVQSRIAAIRNIGSVLASLAAPLRASLYRHVYINDTCAQIAAEMGQRPVEIWEGCFQGFAAVRASLAQATSSHQIESVDVESTLILYYRYFHKAER